MLFIWRIQEPLLPWHKCVHFSAIINKVARLSDGAFDTFGASVIAHVQCTILGYSTATKKRRSKTKLMRNVHQLTT